jgi:hypothetical protein
LIEIADPDVLGSLPGNGNLASDARVFQHESGWQPLGVTAAATTFFFVFMTA